MNTYKKIKKWLRFFAVLVCVFFIGLAAYSLIATHYPYQSTYNYTILDPIEDGVIVLILTFLLWPD